MITSDDPAARVTLQTGDAAAASLIALYCRETGLAPSQVALCQQQTPDGVRLWCEPRARHERIRAEAIERALHDDLIRLLATASLMLISPLGTYSWAENVATVAQMQEMLRSLRGVAS